MKNARKTLRIVLLVIIVLVVSIVVLIHLLGNSVLKTGIETAASKTLNVGVSIDNMDFSILGTFCISSNFFRSPGSMPASL